MRVIAVLALALAAVAADAQPYGRAGMPATGQCAPGWLGIDPDATSIAAYQFEVRVTEPTRVVRWRWEYVSPTKACCDWQRVVAADVVRHLPPQPVVITIGECR